MGQEKRGRPTKYSDEYAKLVCDRIATHTWGLNRLCAVYEDMPDPSTIYQWRYDYEDFSQKYAQAKMNQADLMAEEVLDIADEATHDTKFDKDGNELCNTEFIARSRLRVDTRKWLASKLLPKQYGDARRVEDLEGQNDSMRRELQDLRKQLDEKNKKDY